MGRWIAARSVSMSSRSASRQCTHSDKLFRWGRMDAHGGVKIGLGQTRPDCNGNTLDQLPCLFAHHMGSNDDITGVVDNQLHQHTLLTTGKRMFHGAKIGAIDTYLAILLARCLC